MSYKQLTLTSIAKLFSNTIIVKVIGLSSMLILARILTPGDFGVVAIATSILYLLDIFTETGAQKYITQKQHVNWDDIFTAWTFQLILKTTMTLFLCGLAYSFAGVLGEPTAIALASLSVVLLLDALKSPKVLLCKRCLIYSPIVRMDIIAKLFSTIIAISLALYLESYLAIIIAALSFTLMQLCLSYLMLPMIPVPTLKCLNSQVFFTKYSYAQGVVGYLRSELDILLSGFYFSNTFVGGYSKTKEIATMPGRDFIGPVMEPLLGFFRSERDRQKESQLLMILSTMLFLSTPVGLIFFLYHEEITVFLLGKQWQPYSSMLAIFSIFVIQFSIYSVIEEFFIANHKLKTLVSFECIFVFFLMGLLIVGQQSNDIEIFAMSRAIFTLISIVGLLFLLQHTFKIHLKNLLRESGVTAISAYIAYLLMIEVDMSFFVECVLLLITYALLMACFTCLIKHFFRTKMTTYKFVMAFYVFLGSKKTNFTTGKNI